MIVNINSEIRVNSRPLTVTRMLYLSQVSRLVNFSSGRIPLGGKSPEKCIYDAPAQPTAKRRAKFG